MYTARRTSAAALIALAFLASSCSSNALSSDNSSSDQTSSDSSVSDNSGGETTDSTDSDGTSLDPTDSSSSDGSGSSEQLDWMPCDDSTLECATLTVPLDYDDPDGTQIDLAIARVATVAADRIGSVVLNPGGPGGSGITYLETASLAFPAAVAARFDLVSFDPRGVGASTATDCDLDFDDVVTAVDDGDDAAWQALFDSDRALFEQCSSDVFELAEYVGTNSAARDLDRLRAALGDEQLTYVGYSYGTRLGAAYAEQFPQNVRALVLDAGVLPNNDLNQLGREQARGFESAFGNFAAACDADSDCPLQELGTTESVFRAIESELEEVGTFSAGDRVLTRGEFYVGVLGSLYSVDAWPILAEGLYLAETQADGEVLHFLGDPLLGRQPDGTYDNSNEANVFINCADDPGRQSVDELRAELEAAAALTDHFADLFRGGSGCANAPDPIDPLQLGPASGAAPIVVIGNTGDPATPYEWSQQLADSLESGVLFTVEAEGHTAYGTFECVRPAIDAYLIDLVVPEEGASCSENATADFFPPAGQNPFLQLIAFFDCLRAEGLPVQEVSLVDLLADPTGESLFDGIQLDPPTPEVQAAFLACQSLLPS